MNINNEISSQKHNIKKLPKIKSDNPFKIDIKMKNSEPIILYNKLSEKISTKSKHKKNKKRKLRHISVGAENKIMNLIESDKSKIKLRRINSNDFSDKKSFLKELSARKKIFSEKVKLIKIIKRNNSPKPKEETSLELIKKYSLKVLGNNRSSINNKKQDTKDLYDKLDKIDNNSLMELDLQKIRRQRNLPSLLRENYSSLNLHLPDNNLDTKHINNNTKITKAQLNINLINKRYLMMQYSAHLKEQQQNQEKKENSININSNLNISSNKSENLNQNNLKGKLINNEKESINEKHSYKLKSEFSFKEFNYLNYAIVPGNASYLVKNCMCHRINWKESFSTVTNMYNFKWQQNTNGICYSKFGKYGEIRQVVNHFENNTCISNKANMFINLMFYCEQRKISVFKYVPLTIIFELDFLDNLESETYKKKLEMLKKFVDEDEANYVKKYEDIGNYFQEEKFKEEKNKRVIYIKNKERRSGFYDYFYGLREEEEKNKSEKKKIKYNYPTYIDYFKRPELVGKITTIADNNYEYYSKNLELEKDMSKYLGISTIIEIPETHYSGKNMWIIKAINLCQGKCMQISHNFNQMLKILKKFKEGVEFDFTEKVIEEKQDSKNNNLDKNKKNDLDLYCCRRIIIQKYIERPLLYKGRKCDMRVWVLITQNLKVYFFKEGHLKTCSIPFDIESKDAYTHITNYSFQKYNECFQKYEKGNEVPFYDFQKFIDEQYPDKNYKLNINLYSQIKEIVAISMKSVKEQIDKNGNTYQFEIFGYDFMLDENFNLFLIEVNTNPGLEESSPWIQIIVPRMLDDALRLTIDQLFNPAYDFSKMYKKDNDENTLKIIANEFKNKVELENKYLKTEINPKIQFKKENEVETKKKRMNTESININDVIKKLIQKPEINTELNKNDRYISPFPVPGYKNDENLWEFVCDLTSNDPLDEFLDKDKENEKCYTGIRYLFNKKKNNEN